MKTEKVIHTRGIVLMAVLAVITALALLAGTIAVVATRDIRITAQFKKSIEALHTADAAVHVVKTLIEDDLGSGALVLDSATENVNYQSPNNLTFDAVQELIQTVDTNAYFFRVTGRAGNASSTIETVFRPASAFDLGLFGDKEIDMKAYANVYTYNSRTTPDPAPEDSLGGGEIASNGDFLTHQDTFIDGSFMLGESAGGVEGSWRETPVDGSIIEGEAAVACDRIDPDPLGAIGGDLANDFALYSSSGQNDNNNAIDPIRPPQNNVRVNNGGSLILPTGNYYIHDLILNNGATLTINPSSGPVNIYLTGQLEAKTGSSINASGTPPDLNIFSNSTDPVIHET